MKGAAVLKRIRKPLVSLLLAAVLACALFALSSAAGLFGDIDGDGGVTYEDAQLLFDYVAGAGRLTVSQLSAADINRDGSVTIGDAAMLFHYVSGLFPSLPFEEGEYARLAVHTLPKKSNTLPAKPLIIPGWLSALYMTAASVFRWRIIPSRCLARLRRASRSSV